MIDTPSKVTWDSSLFWVENSREKMARTVSIRCRSPRTGTWNMAKNFRRLVGKNWSWKLIFFSIEKNYLEIHHSGQMLQNISILSQSQKTPDLIPMEPRCSIYKLRDSSRITPLKQLFFVKKLESPFRLDIELNTWLVEEEIQWFPAFRLVFVKRIGYFPGSFAQILPNGSIWSELWPNTTCKW